MGIIYMWTGCRDVGVDAFDGEHTPTVRRLHTGCGAVSLKRHILRAAPVFLANTTGQFITAAPLNCGSYQSRDMGENPC